MPLTRTHKIGIFGLCLFIYSILFMTVIFPSVLNMQVKHKVALKNGWIMRELWGKFPFAFEFQFYFFNVTNPDAIKAGDKPILQEVGPFVYDEWQEKTNQIDHDKDDTVSYTFRSTFYFNKEKSGFSDEEELTVPNYFILGLVNTLMIEKPSVIAIAGKAIDSIFKKPDNIFMKVKVKDILFEGLTIDCRVSDFAGTAVCSEISANYEKLRFKKLEENVFSMSFWGPMNGTDAQSRLRVYRGIKNVMDVGIVVEYNHKPNVSTWNDDYCDAFNGTDGTIFHPYFDKNGRDDLVVFNGDLCRNIICYFDSKTKFAGLKTLRYTTDLGVDPKYNPRHKCYCRTPDSCLKKGVYDTFKCTGSPLIISNPHFYMADPYYLSMVGGLKPIKENHMLIVDLDAFTGAPVHVHKRVQFNMFITKIEKFKLMKNFPDALLPLFWFDQIIILPDFLLKDIKFGHTMYKLGLFTQYFCMFAGLGICGYAGFKQFQSMQNPEKLNKKVVVTEIKNGHKLDNSDISVIQPAAVLPQIN